MTFAKSRRANIELLAVGDGGSELIYRQHKTPLNPSLLCRDQDGVRTSRVLDQAKGLQSWVVLVAVEDRIAGFTGDELLLFDRSDLAKVSQQKIFQWNGIGTRFVASANQKYLFFNSQGGDRESYFRSCIVDLTSGEVTWKGEPFAVGESTIFFDVEQGNELVDWSSTVMVENTIVEFLPVSSSGTLVPVATCSFETGVPTRVGSGSVLPFLSADGERSIVEVPGVGFKLMNQGAEVTLNVKLPSDYLQVKAQSEHRILFHHNGVFKLFDWRTMKIENVIEPVGNYGAPTVVLSPDGNTIAQQVAYWNYTWADCLRRGCESVRSRIEVYDAKTGAFIRVVEDDRPFWTWVVLAIGGSLVWSIAWIWVRSSDRNSNRTITDVLVVSLLWFSIALLRYVFGGWLPDSMASFHSDRPSSVALTCMLSCLMVLVPVWAVFAKLRLSFRIPIALIGVALLWGLQVWLWTCFGFEYGALRLDCLFVLIGVFLICVMTRMFGWKLGPSEATDSDAQKHGAQVPLVDLFLFPLAIGLCFPVFTPILQGVPFAFWDSFAIQSLPIVLTALMACWAAFSVYEKPKWILGSIFLICLLASLTRFHFWNESAYYTIYGGNMMASRDIIISTVSHHLATASGSGMCLLLAMCHVSRLGWKWQRKQRLLESAT